LIEKEKSVNFFAKATKQHETACNETGDKHSTAQQSFETFFLSTVNRRSMPLNEPATSAGKKRKKETD
jgi:hypothetical protein